jgi:hypothetical protein
MPITDVLSKLNAFETLKCGFVFHVLFTPFAIGRRSGRWSVNCGRTSIVLADQRASTGLKAMAFNQQLGHYGLKIISEVEDCASTSYAIAAERQSWITEHADFRVNAIERRTS